MPRKLGQHFLIRDAILERLAAAACGDQTRRVLEIGPGGGALTRHLLPRTEELHAIELDATLAERLRAKFAGEPKLHVHRADVLATDLTRWGAAVISGNLPYYITSPIIEKFLALDERFERAVFVVQWEVAERLLAQAGTRAYGYLSVAVQLVCDVEMVCRIPATAFVPPPKVESAGIRFQRKQHPPDDLQELLTFAGRCFAHKRKTLRNNLRPYYGAAIDAQPEAGLRAEQLELERFRDLYARLNTACGNS
ncbi:MAG: ribosomal RNA small subunit methyltransferase A [Acidobacteriaceae bacterium]|nr:ribosomal RNA small subunit methyltransferase A [Acidobacteriaceae bacterium]